jgi:integrase
MRTKQNTWLPEWVARYKDRHGKWRYRFRRKGSPSGHFKHEPGTVEFAAEYAAFKDAAPTAIVGKERYAPGTIGVLVGRYCAVATRLGPTAVTQAKVRSILSKFRDDYGHYPVAGIGFEHVDAIIEKRREKVQVGKRMEGGVEAARKLRKELVRLFAFAKKAGMRPDNPVQDADRVKVSASERTGGRYSWSEQDIAQFRARHALGTRPRLAMELLLWTGQRRSDGVWLGPADITDGRVEMSQSKTGKALGLRVPPQLSAAIEAMPPMVPGQTTYLVTGFGKPYSKAGFGNAFRDWCDEAGLPQCTAHGLRKAMMRRLSEQKTSQQGIKAVSGHSGDQEVALYVAAANQRAMADDAITSVSDWELSNQP